MAGDPPIEEQEYIVPQVIDFGDIRVARGMSRRPAVQCVHNSLTYDLSERRVWCRDCETTLEGFDAFMVLVERWQMIDRDIRRKHAEAQEARASVVHRIAARELESIWRHKMAASCPHCNAGLLPEDVERCGSVSREIEIARRKRASKDT